MASPRHRLAPGHLTRQSASGALRAFPGLVYFAEEKSRSRINGPIEFRDELNFGSLASSLSIRGD